MTQSPYDHKFQTGGDAGYCCAFDPTCRKLWRFGGDDTDTSLIQWVDIDTWVAGSLRGTTIPNAGGWAVYSPKQKLIYIYGGRVGGSAPWSSACYSFDPVTEVLTLLTETLPALTSSMAAGFYPGDGKIYIFGGTNASGGVHSVDTISVHDPLAQTITDTTATLPQANAAMGIAFAHDVDLFYLVGGFEGNPSSVSYDTIVTYKPSTPTVDAVDTGEVISNVMENQACAYVPNPGRIYCINGFYYGSPNAYVDTIHKIVTSTNTVSTLVATGHRVDDDAFAFYDSKTAKIYAGPFIHSSQAVDNNGPDKKIIYEFDPTAETLATEASLT